MTDTENLIRKYKRKYKGKDEDGNKIKQDQEESNDVEHQI